MTVPVERPPAPTEGSRPADEAPEDRARPTVAEKLGIEERGWLLFACVIAFIVLAFVGMFVLTALGGGTTYLR
jgi:hypothetical protein